MLREDIVKVLDRAEQKGELTGVTALKIINLFKKVVERIAPTSRKDELDGAVFHKIYINDEEWQALLEGLEG